MLKANQCLKIFITSISNFENRSTFSSVTIATERVPPQEIPLHTILSLFKLFIFRCLFLGTYIVILQIVALVVIHLSHCMYVEFKINELN